MSNKQSISAGDASFNVNGAGNISIVFTSNISPEIIDEKIEEYEERIRKSRYFSEINTKDECLQLGRRLVDENLSGGSNSVRGRALAWCARLLARSEVLRAEEFLEHAKRLGSFTEAKISSATGIRVLLCYANSLAHTFLGRSKALKTVRMPCLRILHVSLRNS